MRRKSARNAQKATPDKPAKESETPPKTRRSRRRKRSPSKSSDSEAEVLKATKREAPSEAPDTTTKSHTPTDEEAGEEPVWKVTPTEDTPRGEIQKLKLCLTRPAPDSPDKSKSRRSKSGSQTEDDTASSEDKYATRKTRSKESVRNDGFSSQDGEEDAEEKKGKGKSKGKHKSKIEKSPHLSETEVQTNNEISENVQVTPQSPSIDKPVDNENDRKVDDDKQNVSESVPAHDNGEAPVSNVCDNAQHANIVAAESESRSRPKQIQSDDDDEPLSVIRKQSNEKVCSQETKRESCEISEPENKTPKERPSDSEKPVEEVPTEEKKSVEQPTDENTSVEQPTKENTSAEQPTEENTSAEQPTEENTSAKQPTEENTSAEQPTEGNTLVEERPTDEDKSVEERPTEGGKPSEVPVEDDKRKPVEKEKPKSPEKSQVSEGEEVQEQPRAETVVESESKVEPVQKQEDREVGKVLARENSEVMESDSSEAKVATEETPVTDETVSVSEEKRETPKERPPLRRLKRNAEYPKPDANQPEEEPPAKLRPSSFKRQWSVDPDSQLIKIDLDAIQTIWPTIDFPEEPDLHLEVEKERRKSLTADAAVTKRLDRKVSVEYKSDFSERPSYDKQTSVGSATTATESEDNANIIAFNRKISIVDDTASKLKPPPSPAKNPPSSVLYITNLVRPFTVKQLKELLERTGKIREEGFWTDRIKSKCYVQYENQEEAEATRNALHGVQWPIGNGKKLMIDFATEEDMQNAKNPPPPPAPAPVEEAKTAAKENVEPVEIKSRPEEKIPKEVEKKRPEVHVREWDIGKKDVRKERSRSRERNRKHRRSPSPTDDFISRKQRRTEESVPQKLMDDLFLKTKATPSIYWQPLSPEEISMKQQQRLIRMEEHKRRMEENSRMKGGRDMGRGAFRRRYD